MYPFGLNRHGPKISGFCPFLGGGAGSPSNTVSLRLRLTFLLSGILIHPAVWPQQIWAENWGAVHIHCTILSLLRIFWATTCYQAVVCLSVLSCLSVCEVGILWPNSWMDQDETWHAVRTLPWPHCIRWVPSSLPQMAGQTKMPLGMEVGLNAGDFVLDGDPAPPPKKGQNPEILGPCLLRPKGYMH